MTKHLLILALSFSLSACTEGETIIESLSSSIPGVFFSTGNEKKVGLNPYPGAFQFDGECDQRVKSLEILLPGATDWVDASQVVLGSSEMDCSDGQFTIDMNSSELNAGVADGALDALGEQASFQIRGINFLGSTQEKTVTVIADDGPPDTSGVVVNLVSSSPSNSFSVNLNVTGLPSDVTKISVYRDSAVTGCLHHLGVFTHDGSSSASITTNLNSVYEGDNYFSVKLGDNLGQESTACAASASAVYQLDLTDPLPPTALTLTNITGGGPYYNNDGAPGMTYTGSASGDLLQYNVYPSDDCTGTVTTLGAGVTTHSESSLSDGPFKFSIYAVDTAGNTSTCAVSEEVIVDQTAPNNPTLTWSLSSPNQNGAVILTASGLTSGDTVEFYSTSGCPPTPFLTDTLGAGETTGEFDNTSTPFSDGTHDVWVLVKDGAGNINAGGCMQTTFVRDSLDPNDPGPLDIDISGSNNNYEGTTLNAMMASLSLSPKFEINSDPPTDNGDAGFDEFDYRIMEENGGTDIEIVAWTELDRSSPTDDDTDTNNEYQITGLSLTEDTEYYIELRSRDKAGNVSSTRSTQTWWANASNQQPTFSTPCADQTLYESVSGNNTLSTTCVEADSDNGDFIKTRIVDVSGCSFLSGASTTIGTASLPTIDINNVVDKADRDEIGVCNISLTITDRLGSSVVDTFQLDVRSMCEFSTMLTWDEYDESDDYDFDGSALIDDGLVHDGTTNPHLICTEAQLRDIMFDNVTDGEAQDIGCHIGDQTACSHDFEIRNDITLTADIPGIGFTSAAGWYSGTFNGKGFTIGNVRIDESSTDQIGFFRIVDGGTVENLNLVVDEIDGQDETGALIGRIRGTSLTTVQNINIVKQSGVSSVAGRDDTGGVIGAIFDGASCSGGSAANARVLNVGSAIDVTASGDDVGGIVGCLSSNHTSNAPMEETYSFGSVSGSSSSQNIGGLVGYAKGWSNSVPDIYRSFALGDVSGPSGSERVGGLVGYLTASAPSTPQYGAIEESFAEGDVTGGGNIGGLVGGIFSAAVIDSYSLGDVISIASGNGNIGGLVGEASGEARIEKSFSRGDITGSSSATISRLGGLVGFAAEVSAQALQMSDSYATGDISTNKNSPSVKGGGLVGAIVGSVQKIEYSYYSGTITTLGSEVIGGLTGNRSGAPVFVKNFWQASSYDGFGDVPMTPTDDQGIGVTLAALKLESNYLATHGGTTYDWNFSDNSTWTTAGDSFLPHHQKIARKPYRIAFVTTTEYRGAEIESLQNADHICQSRSEDGSSLTPPGIYRAIMSDSSIDAKNHIHSNRFDRGIYIINSSYNWDGVSNQPVKDTDFIKIADDRDDMFDGDNLFTALTRDETGANSGAVPVWTGTKSDGTASSFNCLDWTSDSSGDTAQYGLSSILGGSYLANALRTCDQPARVYCISH